jgi:segregation and condensation protein A
MSIVVANNEFEEDPPRDVLSQGEHEADSLLLNIDGFEGPIDVLLSMARDQKVDLTKVSILQLARQYLEFVDRAKELHLDLAAEYLVMAAWLAYLKSRLLLPKEEDDGELSGEQMAEALAFQLRRLDAMREVADDLFSLPQLGQDIFPRGMPEGLRTVTNTQWDVKLYDLIKAYGDIQYRKDHSNYELPVFNLISMEEALSRLTTMLGKLPRKGPCSVWATLGSFLPDNIVDSLMGRSAIASTFTAGLELAKQGKLELKQDGAFRPIYLRALAENLQNRSNNVENAVTREVSDDTGTD